MSRATPKTRTDASVFATVSTEPVRLVEPEHEYFVGEGITEREVPALSRVFQATGFGIDRDDIWDPEQFDRRTMIGSLVHSWCEAYLRDGESAADAILDEQRFLVDEAAPHIEAFIKFTREHVLEPVRLEVPMYQPQLGYCCTPDFLGFMDGKAADIDYKTVSRLKKSVALQVAGQKLCLITRRDVMGYALHLRKDGTYKLRPYPKWDSDSAAVVAIANAYSLREAYV